MKKLFLVILVLLILLLPGAYFLSRNLDDLLLSQKPKLEALIKEQLGKELSFKDLKVALWPTPNIKLSEVVLKGDSPFFKELNVASLSVFPELAPLIEKEFVVKELKISDAKTTLFKGKESFRFNDIDLTSKLSFKDNILKFDSLKLNASLDNKIPVALEVAGGSFSQKSSDLNLKNSELSIAEQTLPFKLALNTKDGSGNIEISKTQINLRELMPLSNYFSELRKQDLNLGGDAVLSLNAKLRKNQLDSVKGRIDLADLMISSRGMRLLKGTGPVEVSTDRKRQLVFNFNNVSSYFEPAKAELLLNGGLKSSLSGALKLKVDNFNINELSKAQPLIGFFALKYGVNGVLGGDLDIALQDAALNKVSGILNVKDLGAKYKEYNLKNLNGALDLNYNGNSFNIKADNLKSTLNELPLKLGFKASSIDNTLKITEIKFSPHSGTLKGEYHTSLKKLSDFNLKLSGSALKLEELLYFVKPELATRFKGTIQDFNTTLTRSVRGVLKALYGTMKLKIEPGVIKDINIGRLLFTKVGEVPIVGKDLIARVPKEFNPYFEDRDTPVKRLVAQARFINQDVVFEELRLVSDVYGVIANGRIVNYNELKLRAVMVCDKDLSTALVKKIKELQILIDDQGLLRIPFTVSGDVQSPDLRPDLEKVVERGAQKVIQNELIGILGDLIQAN